MARYKILLPIGVHDSQVPAHDVFPSNYLDWNAYLAWLALGNIPDPADPPPAQYPTLASQRTEMLARLDAVLDRKSYNSTVVLLGHTWKLGRWFVAMLTLSRASAALPAGFALVDANRVSVPLTNAQLNQLSDAVRDKLLAMQTFYVGRVTAINASATPLTVNIDAGWP